MNVVIDLTNNAFMKIQRHLSSFLIVHCLAIFSPFILYIFNPKEMKKIASSVKIFLKLAM